MLSCPGEGGYQEERMWENNQKPGAGLKRHLPRPECVDSGSQQKGHAPPDFCFCVEQRHSTTERGTPFQPVNLEGVMHTQPSSWCSEDS